ncbi:MAG: TetR/AcrR family transcriptional regulator [Acidimicrobiia bacterium]
MADDSRIAARRRAALEARGAGYMERRRQLVEAAARVFAEKGFHKTSFSDIAEHLEIDRASLYYYVGSKSDLFEAVALAPAEENIRSIEEIRASDLAPQEKLTAAIEQLMASFHERYPYLYIYIREDVRKLEMDAKRDRRMHRIERRYNAAFVDIIVEGQESGAFDPTLPPKVLAYSIVGMLAWSHQWFRPDGSVSGPEIGQGLATMVLEGLERKPAAKRARRKAP